ncbi:MAG: haloacid dehalogenase [Acidimicrobiia bacterium]|nr:haloacid dehalogenase [Acidimicrobiia bacterium]NNC75632.1 haloacid dehalogenase [Acidimicrobiia bacterium]
MSSLGLDPVGAEAREELDAKFAAREQALRNCRKIIQASSKAIRALHRGETEVASGLISDAETMIAEIEPALAEHPDIYHAGFFYDAVKEYGEAAITRALVAGDTLPLPSELGLHAVPYLKGLGEAVGELRRRLLDQLRNGDLVSADATFGSMDAVVDFLMELDYPDGMTSGLRRTTDMARSLVERSRSDLTTAALQERYRAGLS